MFTIENAIQNWKHQLRANPAFEDGDIAELESHIRDEINRLIKAGATEEEAFREAVNEIGKPDSIGDELYKNRTTRVHATPSWKQKSWMPSILPNYIKVALRNFRSNLAFSIINVLGLSVAISICLLVIIFTKDQADYDKFHAKSDRIYRVNTTLKPIGQASLRQYASSPFRAGPMLENNLPDIVETVRLKPFSGAASYEDKRLGIRGFHTDATFFELFDFPLRGNPEEALTDPYSIILTAKAATKFFGKQDPIGKEITLSDGQLYTITGVTQVSNVRSHLEFDALIALPGSDSELFGMSAKQDWGDPKWYTYILTEKSVDPGIIETKIPELVQSYNPNASKTELQFDLQQLSHINLGPILARQIGRVTPVEFVYFLSALALVILLASGINYINFSVARSSQRAREIGMRKVIGANRRQLMGQFLSESIVTAGISLAIGLLIFWGWLLPYWNGLNLAVNDFGRISPDLAGDMELYLIFVGFTILVGFFAGSYPAFKLSSFAPVEALKKKVMTGNVSGWSMRKTLLVVQITISVILVVSTFLLYRQANLLLNNDYEFDTSNIVNVNLGNTSYDLLKNEIANQTGVENVSAISTLPAVHFPDWTWAGISPGRDSINTAVFSADQNLIENFGLSLAAGRNFSSARSTDTENAVIINEKAVEQLGLQSNQDAVGKYIVLSDGGTCQIIGVLRNFQFDFLWKPISPLIIRNIPSEYNYANIRLSGGEKSKTLDKVKEAWVKIVPNAPFEYEYYGDQIENVYTDFKELAGIVGFLTGIAILVASLGLLAMVVQDTRTREKELGIRKVLGAKTRDLIVLLSSDVAKMTLAAFVIGLPVTFYLNKLWLQIFANRIEPGIWTIAAVVAVIPVLIFLSIGWHIYSVVTENPVNSLRNE